MNCFCEVVVCAGVAASDCFVCDVSVGTDLICCFFFWIVVCLEVFVHLQAMNQYHAVSNLLILDIPYRYDLILEVNNLVFCVVF